MPFTKETARLMGARGGLVKAPHTLTSEKTRAYVIKTVATRMKPIMMAAYDLAIGHYKERAIQDENGITKTTRVYKVSPSNDAIQYLLNQTIGKPKEITENKTTISLVLDF